MAQTTKRYSKPTAKAFLEGVRESVLRLDQLRDKVAMLSARLDGIGAVDCSRDRVRPSCDGAVMERRVLLYQDARRELDEQEAYCDTLLGQAAGVLRAMVDGGCPGDVADELEYYYLWGMSTSEIALAVHASESCVRMHRMKAFEEGGSHEP